MREIEGFIANLLHNPESRTDLQVRKNVQVKLASSLQGLTQNFRVNQKLFMERLKGGQEAPSEEEAEGEGAREVLDDFNEIARDRDESINALVNNLNELALMFKSLNSLVLTQGTVLDRVDYNIEQALGNVAKARGQLAIAERRSRSSRAFTCMMLLIVCIVLMSLVLIYR